MHRAREQPHSTAVLDMTLSDTPSTPTQTFFSLSLSVIECIHAHTHTHAHACTSSSSSQWYHHHHHREHDRCHTSNNPKTKLYRNCKRVVRHSDKEREADGGGYDGTCSQSPSRRSSTSTSGARRKDTGRSDMYATRNESTCMPCEQSSCACVTVERRRRCE